MVRASLTLGTAVALFGLAFAAPAWAGSGSGSSPSSSDPATSVYMEQIPAAGGTANGGSNGPNGTARSSDPATSVYVEQVPAAGGVAGSSTRPSAALTLRQLLTSPALGAPQRTQPFSGNSTGTTYGTFSFQTVREVAGVGTTRLAGLLGVLVLISVALAAAAFRRFSSR